MAQAFVEILEGFPNAINEQFKEDMGLVEAVGILTGQVFFN